MTSSTQRDVSLGNSRNGGLAVVPVYRLRTGITEVWRQGLQSHHRVTCSCCLPREIILGVCVCETERVRELLGIGWRGTHELMCAGIK